MGAFEKFFINLERERGIMYEVVTLDSGFTSEHNAYLAAKGIKRSFGDLFDLVRRALERPRGEREKLPNVIWLKGGTDEDDWQLITGLLNLSMRQAVAGLSGFVCPHRMKG